MALAERAQALALTGFATMVVRRDEPPKKEDQVKCAYSNDFQDGRNAQDKTAKKLRTADLLPPVIWGGR